MPGGEAAPTCRLSGRVSCGEKGCFPVPLPAQPKARASPEQGQGKQEAAGARRELGELGRYLLNHELIHYFNAEILTAVAIGTQVGSLK